MNPNAVPVEPVDSSQVPDLIAWGLISLSLVAGCAMWMWLDSRTVFWFAMPALALCGALGMARCVLAPRHINIWDIFASALALAYGVGTFNTLASLYTDVHDLVKLTTASAFFISKAIAALLLLFSLMTFLGRLDKSRPLAGIAMTPDAVKVSTYVLVPYTVAVLGMFATGGIGFMGDVKGGEDTVHVNAGATLIAGLMLPLVGLALYTSANAAKRDKTILWACSFIIELATVSQGRRVLLYSLLICVMCFIASRPKLKLLSTKNVLIGLMIVVAANFGMRMFYSMRVALQDLDKNPSIVEMIQKGIEVQINSDKNGFDESLSENRQTRTFIIGYLSDLMERTEVASRFNGELLEFNLAYAVPTVIWPGKWRVVKWASEENLTHPILGLPTYDAPNSVLTAALCDFGLWGFFLYPVMFAAMFSLLCKLARMLEPVIFIPVIVSFIYILFNTETTISTYFFVVRDRMVYVILMLIFLFVLRWRLDQAKANDYFLRHAGFSTRVKRSRFGGVFGYLGSIPGRLAYNSRRIRFGRSLSNPKH